MSCFSSSPNQVILSLAGGLMGIALGAVLVPVGVGKGFGLTLTITPTYIILSVFISTAVGVVSGLYPARRAARIDPLLHCEPSHAGRISIRQTLSLALSSVWGHRFEFQTRLTILGIVIGITTVVTVAALLHRLTQKHSRVFQEIGPNSIFVARVSGDPRWGGCRPQGVEAKATEPRRCGLPEGGGARGRSTWVSRSTTSAAGSFLTAKIGSFETENISIAGQSANLLEIAPRELGAGRYFTEQERARARRQSGAHRVQPGGGAIPQTARIGIGQTVLVDGAPFTSLWAYLRLPRAASSARTDLIGRCSSRCRRRACVIRNRRTSS